MHLTKEEKEMIIHALQLRRNYITTGTVSLSLEDCANLSTQAIKDLGGEIKALNDDQMRLCVATNDLIRRIMLEA